MAEQDPRVSATRVGIEFLTLWLEPGVAARQAAADHMFEVLKGSDGRRLDQAKTHEALSGLLNLGSFLVFQLAKAQGATTGDEAYEKAAEILRGISQSLPE